MSILLSSPQGRALLKHRKKVKKIVTSYGYSNPACFGSVARGTATSESDIDLLVEMEPKNFDPDLLVSLAEKLEQVVGYPFDIATPSFMRESVALSAAKEAIKL